MENPYARELTVKRRCVGVTRTAPRMTYPSAGSYQRAWPKYNPPATPSSVCPNAPLLATAARSPAAAATAAAAL